MRSIMAMTVKIPRTAVGRVRTMLVSHVLFVSEVERKNGPRMRSMCVPYQRP